MNDPTTWNAIERRTTTEKDEKMETGTAGPLADKIPAEPDVVGEPSVYTRLDKLFKTERAERLRASHPSRGLGNSKYSTPAEEIAPPTDA